MLDQDGFKISLVVEIADSAVEIQNRLVCLMNAGMASDDGEAVFGMLWANRTEKELLAVNAHFTELFGWTFDDMLEMKFEDILHEKDRDFMLENDAQNLSGCSVVRILTSEESYKEVYLQGISFEVQNAVHRVMCFKDY